MIVLLITTLALQSAGTGKREIVLKPICKMEDDSPKPLAKALSLCQIAQHKREFYHEHLWQAQNDWQLRGDQIFTSCVEKALFCLDKNNIFALANLEAVHVPRLVAAYHAALTENLESKNKLRYFMMQSSFNLFKAAVEQYKTKYQICPKAQAICQDEHLPDNLRADIVALIKPEIDVKTNRLLESLAHDIKTKYKF